MRKINKIINIASILVLIGGLVCIEPAFGLRPPSLFTTEIQKIWHYDSDKELVLSNPLLLEMLSPQQRNVLTKLFIEGMPPKKVAIDMSISQPAVSIYKRRGLSKLRKLLDPDSDYQIVVNNQHLLKYLGPQQRNVLTKLFIEGIPPENIASDMKISKQLVSFRKKTGLENLKKILRSKLSWRKQVVPSDFQSLYYSAAGSDLDTLVGLMETFKELETVTFCSFYYSSLKPERNPFAATHNETLLQKLYLKLNKYFIVEELKLRKSDDGKNIDTIYLRSRNDKNRNITLTLISRDLYDFTFESGASSIHIAKVPGDRAYLSTGPSYYKKS